MLNAYFLKNNGVYPTWKKERGLTDSTMVKSSIDNNVIVVIYLEEYMT